MSENTTTDRAAAARTEATGSTEPRRLSLAGREYLLPPTSDDWPLETVEAFEAGKVISALRGLLGPEQWQRLKETGATLGDLNALAEQIASVYGFENMGESVASSA